MSSAGGYGMTSGVWLGIRGLSEGKLVWGVAAVDFSAWWGWQQQPHERLLGTEVWLTPMSLGAKGRLVSWQILRIRSMSSCQWSSSTLKILTRDLMARSEV